ISAVSTIPAVAMNGSRTTASTRPSITAPSAIPTRQVDSQVSGKFYFFNIQKKIYSGRAIKPAVTVPASKTIAAWPEWSVPRRAVFTGFAIETPAIDNTMTADDYGMCPDVIVFL